MMGWGIFESPVSEPGRLRQGGRGPSIGRTLAEGIDVGSPLLDVASGERVFDVGCGDGTSTGEMARCVASRRGTRVYAKHTGRT